MGLLDRFGHRKDVDFTAKRLVFRLRAAGYAYEDGGRGLEPVTLAIGERRVAVIGLNGSGKTTLLQLLDGTLKTDRGAVAITEYGRGSDGGDVPGGTYDPAVRADVRRLKDLIGIVRREEIPDRYYLADTIADAVAGALKKRKVPEGARHEIIGTLFAHFDLTPYARSKADALDGRHRHLLAIVGALALNPVAIVADEPTKGLDERGSAAVAEALFGYDRQVVFATHDLDMVSDPGYAIDRAIVLDEGRVAFDGAPADAVSFYDDLVRRRFEALTHGGSRR